MANEFLFNLSDKIAKKLGWGIRRRPRIFRQTFVVSVTTRCNFHCPHCLREFIDEDKKLIRDLSPEIFEEVLREGKKINFRAISFTGGEPILHPQFAGMVSLVKKYGYTYNFITNGWLYEQYWPLIQENRENLDVILLSIDGATAEVHDVIRNKPGSFERLVEAIKFFRKNKIPLMLTFVIMKRNHRQIEEIADFCLRFDIKAIKYAAIISLRKSDERGLSEEEKFDAFQRIISLRKKLQNRLNITMTANLVSGKSLENRFHSPNFCVVLEGRQLYIDHDGAMLFCCDLYQKYPTKPLIQELGFKECLRINLDLINEIKKRHADDLLNNSLPRVSNFCDFCANYVEQFLDLVQE